MISKVNNLPIGIFDSGLGGLTVYRAVRNILPNEDIVYFGDTMRVPYGSKSPETIRFFAYQITSFLKSFNIKAIIVACNTVSSVALDIVKNVAQVDVFGVIEPGAIEALNKTKTQKIIVIGTRATVNSHSYLNTIKKFNPYCIVKEKACPLFVPLVEEGFVNHKVAYLVAAEYLGEFKNTDFDTLILGCTHYPVLKKVISKVLPHTNIIDSSVVCAKHVKKSLEFKNLLSERKGKGKTRFFVSDMPQNFRELAYRLTGIKICKIDIKRF